jgi:hypothetical protein
MGKIEYINSTVPQVELPAYDGRTYEITVPDTLDLQDMAGLGVNGLTGPTDPEADYEIYWRASFDVNREPVMWHAESDCVQAKFIEALPLLRIASGSSQNDHVEKRWMEVIRQMQGPDGLLYIPKIGRPWCIFKNYGNEPPGDHYCNPWIEGRLLGAMTLYFLLTGDDEWKNAGSKVVDGLNKLAVIDGNKAHFASHEFGTEGRYNPPDDPADAIHNMASCQAWSIQGLANYARHTGNEPALDLAGKLARWTIEDSRHFTDDGRFLREYPSNPRIHFHGHTMSLLALLDYGVISGDREVVDFVHSGFRYGMTQGENLLGYFPEWLDVPFATPLEMCELADMIAVAVKLSRHGVGDYWDMADRWLRNLFVEGQLKRVDRFNWLSARIPATDVAPMGLPPYHSIDRVAERNIGAFVSTMAPNDMLAGKQVYGWSYLDGIAHCCTGNATRTIYYAWKNIMTHEAGKLRVNLCLNRGSQWADVNSHIPYKGQVDVKVKEPVELAVRIPEWVKPEETTCTVNSVAIEPRFDGRYAVVGKVVPDDLVTLAFPIAERSEWINVEKRAYRTLLKGNTCIDIDPPGVNVPIFQRDHYRGNETRWRNRTRFVADQQIDW